MKITGKTVYVLGAGASAHTGAPLLRDFLRAARNLRESNGNLSYAEAFDKTFQYIERLRSASYYVDLDLDNLEHVFSIADMERQIGQDSGKDAFDRIREVLLETLDQKCQVEWDGHGYQPDGDYLHFAKKLDDLNQKRRQGIASTFLPDSIITFNYDVMLDYALSFHAPNMQGLQSSPAYCLPGAGIVDGYRLLKLHGSVNWARCANPQCHKHAPKVLRYDTSIHRDRVSWGMTTPDRVSWGMITRQMKEAKCECGGAQESLVIPPTWSKGIAGSPLAGVWQAALEEIRTAGQLIVIGYSMPRTDTFFQYLLALSLQSNPALHRVVVVNTDDGEDFKSRYRAVFSRPLDQRGHLRFLKSNFGDFVSKHMNHYGAEA